MIHFTPIGTSIPPCCILFNDRYKALAFCSEHICDYFSLTDSTTYSVHVSSLNTSMTFTRVHWTYNGVPSNLLSLSVKGLQAS
ncbi:hypothetical protein GDO78_009315 [Eleutherodactylus coqui]|uniref:Uncharacterized protein n=1 Tax=Eleutherodactylus coqui TaxID=57060 RepID=A0A8J6K853_ELECQ|nr:hypothetical protein GDO78_009315 [Eleutherodactylus coqui]